MLCLGGFAMMSSWSLFGTFIGKDEMFMRCVIYQQIPAQLVMFSKVVAIATSPSLSQSWHQPGLRLKGYFSVPFYLLFYWLILPCQPRE